MVTQEQKKEYYLRRLEARRRALLEIRKRKGTLYGSYAVNQHMPSWLKMPSSDYDVFHPEAKKIARQIEKELDKFYGFNAFRVKKARYPATHRIVSNLTQREVLDVTKPTRKIKHTNIAGQRIATLKELKRLAQKSLRNKEASFRHLKDKEVLQRIKILRESRW